MSVDDLKPALRSISAIPVTPFAEDGSVDFANYGRLITRLADGGITVVTPNGNTSEFYALTADEARRAVGCTAEAAAGRMLVMAGVGFDVATAVEAGQAARQAGAVMVMVHQPVHPYQSAEGWVTYHRAICEGLPELGVVPYVRDTSITGSMLRQLVTACPNVVGVKYAVANPLQFAAIIDEVGTGVTWVCGLAELWAPVFWLLGAEGFTSGLVNVDPGISRAMLQALQRGDYPAAMRIWRLVRPFEYLRARRAAANNVSAIKEALAQLGLASASVRPPITELPDSERDEVREILSDWATVSAVSASAS